LTASLSSVIVSTLFISSAVVAAVIPLSIPAHLHCTARAIRHGWYAQCGASAIPNIRLTSEEKEHL